MTTSSLLILIFFSLVVSCAALLMLLGRVARLYAINRAYSITGLPVRQNTGQPRPNEQPAKPYNVFSDNELSLLKTVTLTQADIDAVDANSSGPPDSCSLDHPRYLSAECTICLLPFRVSDVVRVLLCGHMFHTQCIDVWLVQRSARCPLCKLDARRSVGADYTPQNSNADHTAVPILPSPESEASSQGLDMRRISHPPAVTLR